MQNFLLALGICSITMAVIALLFLTLSPLLSKRYSSKWQYYAWLVIILGLIIPFRPDFPFAVFNVNIPAEQPVIQQQEQQFGEAADKTVIDDVVVNTGNAAIADFEASPAENGQAPEPMLPGVAELTDTATQDISSPPATVLDTAEPAVVEPNISAVDVAKSFISDLNMYHVIGIIWLLGVIITVLHNLLRHFHFIRMLGRWSDTVANEEMLEVLYTATRNMAVFNTVKLKVCPLIKSPMLTGFINPTIILHSADISPDELALILRHELTHYKRGDLWYKMLVLLATAIHWFNPVVYLVSKEIALQCEISCDWEVVHNMDSKTKQQYSETIIGVIRQQTKLKTALSTSFYGGKKGMKKRIFSIMDTTAPKTGIAIICLAVFLTMGTGMAFAANIVSHPQNQSNGLTVTPNIPAQKTPLQPVDDNKIEEENNLTQMDDYGNLPLAPAGNEEESNPQQTVNSDKQLPAPAFTVTTRNAGNVAKASATLNGSFANNSAAVEYGFYWGTTKNPSTKVTKGNSKETAVNFAYDITGLSAATTYYFQAYAGTAKGKVQSFTTPPATAITATTDAAINVNNTTATLIGLFANSSGASVEYGFYCGITDNPTAKVVIGNSGDANLGYIYEPSSMQEFRYDLMGLTPNTTYYFKAYAGTATGTTLSFKTLPAANIITATTNGTTSLSSASVCLQGNFKNNDGGEKVEYGFYWGTSTIPTTKAVSGITSASGKSFSYDLIELKPNTTYYFQAYAGTATGTVQTFKTLPAPIAATTGNASNVASSTATLNASFANNSAAIEYGFYWGTTSDPTTKVVAGNSSVASQSFTYDFTGLQPNTTYYFKAYAGTAMGKVQSFKTLESIWVATRGTLDIARDNAVLSGLFENNNDTVEYGFYWGTTSNPTTKVVSGTTSAYDLSFSCVLMGLQPNTTYYFKAYAGTVTGEVQSFTTLPNPLAVTTNGATNITVSSVTLQGAFSNNRGTEEYGFYWGTNSNPTSKVVKGYSSANSLSFTYDFFGLQPNTTYYFKAYAGTVTGMVQSFSTLGTPITPISPVTYEVLSISSTSALLEGAFENVDGLAVEYGFYWGTTSNPTTKVVLGSSQRSYESLTYDLTGLQPNTTYYFKAYAGTYTSAVRSFTTRPSDTGEKVTF